ncbi:MAG: protein kinase [Myxococcota bacterium]
MQYDATAVIDQLLRQHESRLKMYMVCRLGGTEHLEEAYEQFRNALTNGSADALQKAPSLPAFAYAIARRVSLAKSDGGASAMAAVPWLPAPNGKPPRYAEALDRVRQELERTSAEALELTLARGLAEADTAYVVGESADAVGRALAEGVEFLTTVAATLEPAPSPDELVHDAFQTQTDHDPKATGLLPARPARLSEGTVVAGRFEVSSVPHTTSVASVYIAADASVPGQSVVLHLIHRRAPTTAARNGILRKLRLLSSVTHPSVGRILDAGWYGDRLWYATPWYEGHTLGQLVERGSLSTEEVIEMFAPLGRGLGALHQHGVILRDLDENNILVLQGGSSSRSEALPTLTGFDSWLTGELAVEDEPRWLAPEVARRVLEGASPGAGAASEDVFALGLALWYATDVKARRERELPWQEFLARRTGPPIEVRDGTAAQPFAPVLRAALSPDPEARPSAEAFVGGLDAAKPEVRDRKMKRRLMIPVAILGAMIVLGAFTLYVQRARLQMIEESVDTANAQVLTDELEAERARSVELEKQLERASESAPGQSR